MLPHQVAFCGIFTLVFMYFKFLLIWRFARIWALGDGIETADNISSCIFCNHTFRGFWRSWHSSFNLWIVRYIYKGLGGRRSQLWSIWIIFFFVGLWHDLWWSWVAWAMLNCLCFSLEIILTAIFSKKFAWMQNRWYFSYLSDAFGALDLLLVTLANMSIMLGFKGSFDVVARYIHDAGSLTLILSLLSYYATVHFQRIKKIYIA